jgi:hypothetical protein
LSREKGKENKIKVEKPLSAGKECYTIGSYLFYRKEAAEDEKD